MKVSRTHHVTKRGTMKRNPSPHGKKLNWRTMTNQQLNEIVEEYKEYGFDDEDFTTFVDRTRDYE